MTIIQTFISAPMSVQRLKQNILIAAVSLAYAHKSGYKVKMYTDSLAYPLLSKLPYDEINTEMDKIVLPESNVLWSVGKYYALMKEPIGTIHIDFDVLLKKPCLEGLLINADAVCQILEHIENVQTVYEQSRQFLLNNKCNNYLDISKPATHAYNVGIIGYGSESMRKAHAGTIIKLYNKFKKYNKPMPTIDFYIEQANLYNLSTKGYKVNPIIKDTVFFDTDYTIITKYANTIGYCHLQSYKKYTPEVLNKLKHQLIVNFRDIYNSISDIIKITDID